MLCKIQITDAAALDLDEILQYLTEELEQPSAAATLAKEIQLCWDRLQVHPKLYAACEAPQLSGYRKAVIRNYVMIYRIDEEKNTVFVLRFFYGRRDYLDML